jgi:hypothetical protein
MEEEQRWLIELKWWLSSLAVLMAVLMVFEAIPAIYSGFTATPETLAGNDRVGYALSLFLFLPIPILVGLAPFFLAAMLGFRLLVPTFAGAPPRTVGAVVVTWPVMLGAWAVTLLLPLVLWMAAVALVWSRLMPLPKKDIMSRGPVAGGIVIGMTFSAFAVMGALIIAIAWVSWRLYHDHFTDAIATAIVAAIAPGLLQMHDLLTVNNDQDTFIGTLMVVALVGLAVGGLYLSSRRQDGDAAADEPA